MGLFPTRSLHGQDDRTMAEGKGEGKWREEERVTGVPNREGKAKRQWTVATVQEEASGERTVATGHTLTIRPSELHAVYRTHLDLADHFFCVA